MINRVAFPAGEAAPASPYEVHGVDRSFDRPRLLGEAS
jgi:hypothetical protein